MNNQQMYKALLAGLSGIGLAVACGGVADQGVGGESDEIIGGTASNAATTVGAIFVAHAGVGNCTGTLLQNDMILTARHCVTTDGSSGGTVDTTASHFTLTMGAQTRTATDVFADSATDSAMLLVGNFFQMNGSRYDWTRGIYGGTDASLKGKTLTCYGYGSDVFTGCGNDGACTAGNCALRTANIAVSSTTTSSLVYTPNASGQIQWHGDSGGTCFSGASVTGINSFATCPNNAITAITQVGPEAYRGWANGLLSSYGHGMTTWASSSNSAGDYTDINDASLNGNNTTTFPMVTANFNPGGSGGTYVNANPGVWYNTTTSKWSIFNENGSAVPVGAAYNYIVRPSGAYQHTATASNTFAHMTQLNLGIGGINGNSGLTIIVTQAWAGVYNDHPVGVWWNSGDQHWYVYNEDFAAMPVGAKFNVLMTSTTWGGFIHHATASNTSGNVTYLDNPNLNAEPNAQILVTHNFNPSNVGSTYLAHPIGAWYDGTKKKWAVFTQDLSAMPNTVAFNVFARP